MSLSPPHYILARPRPRGVPVAVASCDKEDLEGLEEIMGDDEYIYKLVTKKR